MPSSGRPPGRELTDLEIQHGKLLLGIRDELSRLAAVYDVQLEDFVHACRKGGASARSVAAALGVGSTTVQSWTRNARRRRG